MKTPDRWIALGLMVAGLMYGHAPLRAQPASEPGPTGDEPAPADDEPIVIDDPDRPWNRGVSIERRAAARALFLEGNRRFRIPLFNKAAEKYAAALALWKHPAFYFNLALAQLNLGQEVEAREHLERALAHGEEPLGADQHQEAQRQLREVERQLGRIRVTCQTEGAEVTLDGVRLFTGPGSYEGWAKAKDHELTAKKAGYLSVARQVRIASMELQELELRLVTLSEATDASRRWSVWRPWAVVAAGGAISAAGGALHALSSRSFNAYDEQFLGLPCVTMPDPRSPGCTKDVIPSELNGRLTRARRQQFIAVGSYVAGGSLIAAGVVLLYLNRPRLAEQGVTTSPARGVAIAPAVSEEMLGLLMSVTH